MIIDAHVHPFLDDEHNCGLGRYGGPRTPEEFRQGLLRADITHFCGALIKRVDGASFEPIRQMNRHALRLKEILGDCYYPGMQVHPSFVRESCEEIEYMYAHGVRFIGELVWYMMGYEKYVTEGGMEIFDLAQEKGMVLSVHPTDEPDMEALVKAFPRLPVVFAHPGEIEEYLPHLERMRRYDNAYLDISGTGLFRNNLLRYGIDRVGKDRFLLGTDYPICNPGMQVWGARYEPLTDDELDALLCDNFLSLMGEP